jgi:hypothetical protein
MMMPRWHLRVECIAILVFVCLTASARAGGGSAIAHADGFIAFVGYFDTVCPEGCRDIDKFVSCGSVSACVYCNMSLNGDVELTCNSGYTFILNAGGCSGSFNLANAPWEIRTVDKFMYVFGKFYTYFKYLGNKPADITISVFELVVGLYLITLAARFERVTRILCGLIVGELIAIIALASFNVTLDTFANGVPLWTFPVVLGLVAAVWQRCIVFVAGLGAGFATGCIMVAEVYQRDEKIVDKNLFYVVCGFTAVFIVLARPAGATMFTLFVSITSALCWTAAIIQLAGTYMIADKCNSMTTATLDCAHYGAEGIFVFFLLATTVTQVMVAKCENRRRRRKIAESEGLLGNGSMGRINAGVYGSLV